MNKLKISVNKTKNFIEKHNYRGHDPYDALKSPIFNLAIFRESKLIRFGIQQLLKRSPINLRTILLVPEGINPVTLGLCIQAYTYLSKTDNDNNEDYLRKIDNLFNQLQSLVGKGYSGNCWGYDFPWEARYASIPAYQPTIVATGFVVNALFINYKITGNIKAKELITQTKDFIMKDIKRSYDDDGDFIFSYSPFDTQKVFNASMKGVRILSFIYNFTGDEEVKATALKAVTYLLKFQNKDGSWFYSQKETGMWVDNYHTGYVLDCLSDFIRYCEPTDPRFLQALERGFSFYYKNFFENNRIPKFYNNNIYPIDCTSAAQSIITLLRFGQVDLAENVADYMIDVMQDKNGYFYFRKFKNYIIKTSYMRWSNACMLAALSELLYSIEK